MNKLKEIATYILLATMLLLQGAEALCAGDKKAEDIIDQAKKKYDELKSLKASFTQEFQWKLAENIHQQQGTIWLKGKDKFKIETQDQVVVSDGVNVWTYSAANKQVIIDLVDKSADITLPKDLLLSYSKRYIPKYLSIEKIGAIDCHVIELTSDMEDIFITYMKIWINSDTLIPAKIQQTDLNENINTYILSGIEIDTPMPDDLFHYKSQSDVEVIDMR
ncbi:MAG: LolA family protein [Candidatus Zhuqueibacterota bacterium]